MIFHYWLVQTELLTTWFINSRCTLPLRLLPASVAVVTQIGRTFVFDLYVNTTSKFAANISVIVVLVYPHIFYLLV